MAGDRLTVCEQKLLYAFARPVSIISNFFVVFTSYVDVINRGCCFCVFQLSRAHREHYCDKTESLLPVEHFKLPAPVEDEFKKDVSLYAIHLFAFLCHMQACARDLLSRDRDKIKTFKILSETRP